MEIRRTTEEDFEKIWPTIHDVFKAEETYAFNPKLDQKSAYHIWVSSSQVSYVAVEEGNILGTYYLKAHSEGPGNHVCNCGYIVSPEARGKGVATKLCIHSQEIALGLGFKSMIFTSVVSSNKPAIYLWRKLGYDVVGVIPRAFHHKQLGYVDTYVMYKWLN